MRRVLGIVGICLGLLIIICTAAHVIHYSNPAHGYVIGSIISIAGVMRFLRGVAG